MSELSAQELAARVVDQQRRAVRNELGSALAAFHSPVRDSPRARDVEWAAAGASDRRDVIFALWGTALGEVAELLRVADEHAAGLVALLRHDELIPIPMLSLMRSIHEALLEVCWAIDPTTDAAARTARSAVLVLRTVQGNADPLSQMPNGGDKLTDVREAMAELHTTLAAEHFDLKFDKTNTYVTSVAYEGSDRAALRINITEIAARYTPGSEYMWALGSGATHSRGWFTGGLEGPAADLYIMIVGPLLDFTDAVIDLTHTLVGLPTTNFHRRAHVRRIALFERRSDQARTYRQASYSDYATARASRT